MKSSASHARPQNSACPCRLGGEARRSSVSDTRGRYRLRDGYAPGAGHGHRRSGRLAARGVAARRRVRGLRRGQARHLGAVREPRGDPRPDRADPGRPARRALARRRAEDDPAPRGLQPRVAVVRADVLEAAGADRGVRGGRRDGAARVDPPRRSGDPLLPGVVERDLRRASRGAADGGDGARAGHSVRRRQGLRPPDRAQLPEALRPLRVLGDPLQPRVAAAAARLRHPQGRARRGLDQRSASPASSGSETSTRAATGATRATTCGRWR